MTEGRSHDDAVDLALLRVLFDGGDGVSMTELWRRAGVAEGDGFGGLSRLAAAGCELDPHPQRGVTLVEAGLGVWRPWLADALGDPAEAIHVYRTTSSTQDRAAAARGPGLFVADRQTAGRGRLGRRWHAPPGAALLLTLAVPADAREPPASGGRLTAATAVAVADAVHAATGATAALKWPNDVLLGGGKLAGILVERSTRHGPPRWLIGIGLNVNRPGPAPGTPGTLETPGGERPNDADGSAARPAWLSDHARRRLDRLPLLADLVARVRRWTRPDAHAAAIERWRSACTAVGRAATFAVDGHEVRGDVIDVDPDAGLVVRGDRGGVVHLPAATTRTL